MRAGKETTVVYTKQYTGTSYTTWYRRRVVSPHRQQDHHRLTDGPKRIRFKRGETKKKKYCKFINLKLMLPAAIIMRTTTYTTSSSIHVLCCLY